MEDDAPKASAPPPKPEESYLVPAIMIALVVGIGVFYWLSRPGPQTSSADRPSPQQVAASPAAPPSATPAATPASPAAAAPPPPPPAPPPAPPPPPEPPRESAMEGTLDPSTIAYGVVLLEHTRHAITPAQAAKIKAVFEPDNPAWEYGNLLASMVRVNLTEAQRAFLEAQDPQPVGKTQTVACVATLVTLSGKALGPNVPPPHGSVPRERFDYLEPLVAHVNDLQQNARTRLTAQQAAALAPVVNTFNTVPTRFSNYVLAQLTAEQKAAMDQELANSESAPGAEAISNKLKELLDKKAKGR